MIDLEAYRAGKNPDFEVDFRACTPKPDKGFIWIIAYMWKTDRRKEEDRMYRSSYVPFSAGDKVSCLTCKGVKIVGKIASVDSSYYSGDCPVLYIKSDKRSLTRYLKIHQK